MDKEKNGLIEIRWHGRGGQGVKSASEIFAGLLFKMGKYVQSFPEFGPERSGAPMTAFNRISKEAVRMNHNIYDPDILVIADKTLLSLHSVLSGLKEDGIVLINSSEEEFNYEKEFLETYSQNLKIYIIDANKISSEELGDIYPNISLLSALGKILNLNKEEFINLGKEEIEKMFSQKPDVIKGNIKAFNRAFDEVIEVK